MPGGLAKGTLLLVVFLGVLGYAFHAVEHSPNLRLPAPSFRQIGPKLTPWLAPVETNKEPFLHNTVLHKAKRLFVGKVLGSESVTYGPDGKLYMLDKFGSVLRAKPEAGEKLERVAHLGPGRPLGYHFDAHGNLVICNAGTGLQLLDMTTGKVTLLASEAPVDEAGSKTRPIHYANDLAIASDGSVLFTDSTDIPPAINAAGYYDTMQSFVLAFLQGERTGRLLRYDPGTGRTSLLAHGFWYSNGVTLAKDESFALVVETCTLKVHRIWLKGPRAGEQETFFEDPPGYPDGITAASDGTFWLAVISPRQPALESVLGSRFFRWLIPRLPAPKTIQKGTAVIQLSPEGRVLRYLADSQGSHIATIAAISEAPGGFFLGNLGGDFVSFLSSDSLPPPLNSSAADKRIAADADLSSRKRYASEATISVAAIKGTTLPL